MAGNIGDGTGRDCFDTLGGKKIEYGTGRQNNEKYGWLDGTRRDGGGCEFLDRTGRYKCKHFFVS